MKKFFLTICITITVLFAVIAAKNLCSCEIPIHNRGIGALLDAGDLDVLFIGSSTFRSNLDIVQIEKAYEGKTFILAYGGNQYVAENIQYDEIKNRGGHSYDLLVIELNPMLLTEEVKLSDSRVIWDLSWNGKRRLWKSMADGGNVTFPMFFEYFVTAGMDDLLTYPVTEPFYATRYYKGAKTDETASGGRDFLEGETFDISQIEPVSAQVDALFLLIEKCERDGQDYVVLESPHYYRLQEDPAYVRIRDEVCAQLAKKQAPMILASDVDFDDHEAAYFEDMSHMSAEGRRVYAKLLLPLLQR